MAAGATRTAYYWITGRVDDVINVSGHRMGTAEVESALVAHPKVSEAAVVGYPHDLKGQGIYCYVTLMAGNEGSEALRKELVQWVRKEIGPDRFTRSHPVRAGTAEDSIGQDHATESCARSPRSISAILATSRLWRILPSSRS
jgi:acyl-CoA synthetase (AMP-forming)/AMP-acid ligase II